jgi:hypothetical protein
MPQTKQLPSAKDHKYIAWHIKTPKGAICATFPNYYGMAHNPPPPPEYKVYGRTTGGRIEQVQVPEWTN